jgi:hypothetical protein
MDQQADGARGTAGGLLVVVWSVHVCFLAAILLFLTPLIMPRSYDEQLTQYMSMTTVDMRLCIAG